MSGEQKVACDQLFATCGLSNGAWLWLGDKSGRNIGTPCASGMDPMDKTATTRAPCIGVGQLL
jgi:hypothetical protein